jgi:hypothetical protein
VERNKMRAARDQAEEERTKVEQRRKQAYRSCYDALSNFLQDAGIERLAAARTRFEVSPQLGPTDPGVRQRSKTSLQHSSAATTATSKLSRAEMDEITEALQEATSTVRDVLAGWVMRA